MTRCEYERDLNNKGINLHREYGGKTGRKEYLSATHVTFTDGVDIPTGKSEIIHFDSWNDMKKWCNELWKDTEYRNKVNNWIRNY